MKVKLLSRRGVILAAGIVGGSLAIAGASVLGGGPIQGASRGHAIAAQLRGIGLRGGTCLAGTFCIAGSVIGIGPTSPKTVTLTLNNPNSYIIYVTQLGVTAGQTAGAGGSCDGTDTLASPGWQVTKGYRLTDVVPPTDAIPVPAATSSGPGQASQTIRLSWTDSPTINQTPCLNTTIPLTYSGQAIEYGNCVTGSQSSMKVATNQVGCVSATGKVTNGITVAAGAGLVLQPGASVTGGIKSSGASEILFCGASISGGVKISASTGPVVIGTGNYCSANSITGGASLTNNTGGIEVVNNTITNGLTVTGNSGSVSASLSGGEPAGVGADQYVGGNTISGGITCTPNNSPGLSDGGNLNNVTGSRSGSQCAGTF